MSAYLRDYLTAVIFFGVAMALVAGILGLGSIIRPTRPQTSKYLNYESGVDPVGFGWSQSQIRYYIFAVLFVLFDVRPCSSFRGRSASRSTTCSASWRCSSSS